ncbi:hypothetical protein [Acidocella sp.]|uniref:hypothetical protein n=1 Tax=Acidocella sp. TaxID=50710 RepID=UPI0026100315|nr:hypothetical protein [Acidocella sp.]
MAIQRQLLETVARAIAGEHNEWSFCLGEAEAAIRAVFDWRPISGGPDPSKAPWNGGAYILYEPGYDPPAIAADKWTGVDWSVNSEAKFTHYLPLPLPVPDDD